MAKSTRNGSCGREGMGWALGPRDGPRGGVRAWSIRACFLLLFHFVCSGMAVAQDVDLFRPVPAAQIRAVPAAQAKHLQQLRQKWTPKAVTLVDIDVAALQSETVRLRFPDGRTKRYTRTSGPDAGGTAYVWRGAPEDASGSVSMVVRRGAITGIVRDGTRSYRIDPIAGRVHALIAIESSRFPPEHPPSFKRLERAPGGALPTPSETIQQGLSPGGGGGGGTVTLDVLVYYTVAVRDAVTDIDALIDLAIDDANQSFENSGIELKFRLKAALALLGYGETGKDYSTVVSDFAAHKDVAKARDGWGADVAVLLVDKSEACGMADAILANATTAFAAVHFDCAVDNHSFAHEVGHLLGARHDENNDPGTSPYPYGHGYQHPSRTSAQSFRTVMAYPCSGGIACERVGYWSSPSVTFGTVATGTASTNDNVRVLGANAGFVAAFRDPPGAISGRVTDASSGKPIAGAYVIVRGPNVGEAFTDAGNTDAAGNYRLDRVKAGSYNLTVTATGYQRHDESVVSHADASVTVDVALDMGANVGNVHGTVSDDRGKRVPGATVAVDGTSISAKSDAAGNYTLYDVEAGARTIRAYKGDMGPAARAVTVAARQTITANLTLSTVDACPKGKRLCDDGLCRPACPSCKPPQILCEDGKCRGYCP